MVAFLETFAPSLDPCPLLKSKASLLGMLCVSIRFRFWFQSVTFSIHFQLSSSHCVLGFPLGFQKCTKDSAGCQGKNKKQKKPTSGQMVPVSIPKHPKTSRLTQYLQLLLDPLTLPTSLNLYSPWASLPLPQLLIPIKICHLGVERWLRG